MTENQLNTFFVRLISLWSYDYFCLMECWHSEGNICKQWGTVALDITTFDFSYTSRLEKIPYIFLPLLMALFKNKNKTAVPQTHLAFSAHSRDKWFIKLEANQKTSFKCCPYKHFHFLGQHRNRSCLVNKQWQCEWQYTHCIGNDLPTEQAVMYKLH